MAKGFFHCHTYSANPIACAAANAAIELLQAKEIQENIKVISDSHQTVSRAYNKASKSKSSTFSRCNFCIRLGY